MSNIEPTDLTTSVMDKIQRGEVKMHPRSHYLILGTFGVLAGVMLSLVAAYLMSIMTLWLRIQMASGPAYGARRNLSSLIDQFPWWALILSVLAVIALVFIAHRFGRLYKLRWAYLIAITVLIIGTVGALLSYTHLPYLINGLGPNRTTCDSTVPGDCAPGNNSGNGAHGQLHQ